MSVNAIPVTVPEEYNWNKAASRDVGKMDTEWQKVQRGIRAAYYPIAPDEDGVTNPWYPYGDIRRYGAEPWPADSTDAIQAALNFAGQSSNRLGIFIPEGSWGFTQVAVKNGITIRGEGPGGYSSLDSGGQYGSELRQIAGTNLSGFIFVGNSTPGSQYVSPLEISNMMLTGDTSASAGSAIDFITANGTHCTISEQVHLFNLVLRGWKDNGINFRLGALPLHVRDVELLFNGGYGIKYVADSTKTQAVQFDNISGDGNLSGLIYCESVSSYGSVLFTNIKAEKRVNSDYGSVAGQENVIILHNCDKAAVAVVGCTSISSVPDGGVFEAPGAVIKITGTTTPRLTWADVAVRVRPGDTGSPYTVNDTVNTKTVAVGVPNGAIGDDMGWAEVQATGNAFWRNFGGAIRRTSSLASPESIIEGVTPALVHWETDQAADTKGWMFGPSGGELIRRTLNDDGTTGTIFERATRSGSVPAQLRWVAVDVGPVTAGKGFFCAEGSNAKMGTATLVGGTVTVSTTAVTATSRIFLTIQTNGGTVGTPYISARVAATSFTITSTSGTDTSTLAWILIEPAT